MKYYLISGETSGDLHAAKVIEQLKIKDSKGLFRGIGGDQSQQAGLQLFLHQKGIAFMGFFEVIKNLYIILKTIKQTKKDLLLFRPDRLLLIDYPGFNLKIARFAKAHGIAVHYYIAPKVWAWKENRIKQLMAYTDKVYSILPFETAYFAARGLEVEYVGNPSKTAVDDYLSSNKRSKNEKLIALLPGSRKQEITKNLALMMELKTRFPSHQFAVAQAPGFASSFYTAIAPDVLLEKDMYSLLAKSHLAVVTSGTATLETALHKVPQVVCYRTSKLTYWIAKRFVKISYISLVNIILNKAVVTELIQDDFNIDMLSDEIKRLLSDTDRNNMLKDYVKLEEALGDQNPAQLVSSKLMM